MKFLSSINSQFILNAGAHADCKLSWWMCIFIVLASVDTELCLFICSTFILIFRFLSYNRNATTQCSWRFPPFCQVSNILSEIHSEASSFIAHRPRDGFCRCNCEKPLPPGKQEWRLLSWSSGWGAALCACGCPDSFPRDTLEGQRQVAEASRLAQTLWPRSYEGWEWRPAGHLLTSSGPAPRLAGVRCPAEETALFSRLGPAVPCLCLGLCLRWWQ